MNRERMTEAIALLRAYKPGDGVTFDYTEWLNDDDEDSPYCGIHACAGGLMMLHPPFQAQGLIPDCIGVPTYADLHGVRVREHALAAFLDITLEQATIAFIDLDYRLPEERGGHILARDITADDVANYLETLPQPPLPGTEGVQA